LPYNIHRVVHRCNGLRVPTWMSARAETRPHCLCVRLTCPVLRCILSSCRILCADTYLGGVTMLRRVSVLALALALAACDRGADDGGPSYTDVREAKIHILAGDGQVAPVATSPERAGDLALRLQGGSVEEAYDLFPDVLEVWVGA